MCHLPQAAYLTKPSKQQAQEVDTLRKEAQAFEEVRISIRSTSNIEAARQVFQKVSCLCSVIALKFNIPFVFRFSTLI